MKRGIYTALMLCLHLLSAQDSTHRLLFKTDLAVPPSIGFNTGKAELEVERPVKKNNSLLFSAAYIFSYGGSDGGIFLLRQKGTRGFRAAFERRHYFRRHRILVPFIFLAPALALQLKTEKANNAGFYISGQAVYQQTVSELWLPDGMVTSTTYHVLRFDPALLLRVGFQSITKRGFTIDQSWGIGAHYAMNNSPFELENEFNDPLWSVLLNTKQNLLPAVNYSLKIGFALR